VVTEDRAVGTEPTVVVDAECVGKLPDGGLVQRAR